jgi:hypothetical protein
MGRDSGDESPTSFYGPRQVHRPRRVELARFGGGAGGAGGTVIARINQADARIHGAFSLIGQPFGGGTAPGKVVLAGRNITVWPYAVTDDDVNGQRGTPVADMIPGVTQAAPLAIPIHSGLGGWGREFVSAGDGLELEITIPTQDPGGTAGTLFLQAVFQPVSSCGFIPWSQWDEIRRELEFQVTGFVAVP